MNADAYTPTVRLSLALLVAAATFLHAPAARSQDQTAVTATLATDRSTIYAGEEFNLTLTVAATNIRLGKEFGLSDMPSTELIRIDNFRELPTAPRSNSSGAASERRRFRCTAQALRAGELVFAPTLEYRTLSRQRTFIGSSWVSTRRRLRVTPLRCRFRPIPTTGRPDSFSGAVGQFTMKVAAEPRNVAVGDLVTLSMLVRGNGRLDTATPPRLQPSQRLKVYPAKTWLARGDREMHVTQTVIPQSTNATAIPSIAFTYFDPKQQTFVTLREPEISLTFQARTAPALTNRYRRTAGRTGPDSGSRSSANVAYTARNWSTASPWSLAAIVVGLIAALCGIRGLVGVYALIRDRRKASRSPRQTVSTLIFMLLLALAATVLYRRGETNLPQDATSRIVKVRLAPADSARLLCELPAHTPIKLTEGWRDWRRVESTRGTGWIPADALATRPQP